MRALVAVLVLALLALCAPAAGVASAHPRLRFDLQAHRGGIGLTVESTLAAFAKALEVGVTTLELDVQITRDGREVVTHDRKTNPAKCLDTAPAFPGDPAFPYGGKYVKDLTFAQVRTLDCGSTRWSQYPDQQLSPGARMPTLAEVFALARAYRAHDIRFNIETKVEAAAPHETAPREQFVEITRREVLKSGFLRNVTIQSFDWTTLRLWRQTDPRFALVALTQPEFFVPGSPWTGGLNPDDFGGSPARAAKTLGVTTVSPVHTMTTRALVDDAHALKLKVVPWTVDDPAVMHRLIDLGIDGLITDYPDRLRDVLREQGFALPKRHHR
ncbi:glycerophosphodiester phosphodiesterase family protein [Saccharothrix violaceirubra]|uniref:Glycerophosphoryl diester phosphodiesterase n=1 Tax=Saccharothrix violaceirubra TaxID=413306 RepID=A0A7W7WZD7_9PSEU|nr:glycerophosphodiester phosphodiesterase [Saccharothrix violaceirubra]MBB4969197.1 glycerophosphoryl diester phosphodiesterase [Saccharothrix violaceirubra]